MFNFGGKICLVQNTVVGDVGTLGRHGFRLTQALWEDACPVEKASGGLLGKGC